MVVESGAVLVDLVEPEFRGFFVVLDDVEAEAARFVEHRVPGVVQRRLLEGIDLVLLDTA